MFKSLNALLLAPLLCCFVGAASAGADMTRSASGVGSCLPETAPGTNPNITRCTGTMAGIRSQSADRTRLAFFALADSGGGFFLMIVNGAVFSCTAPSSMDDLWRAAMSTNGYFDIAFDRTTGVCRSLLISGGSNQKVAL